MPGIFICYRREDTEAYAGRIHDRLAEGFPGHRLFMDVEALEPGDDFVTAIERAVAAVDVVIAVMGPRWAIGADDRRYFENPRDWVRTELALALARNLRVIPVLVGGVGMPTAESLPTDLRPLTRLHALEISHTRFTTDVNRLIEVLGRLQQLPEGSPSPTPTPTPGPGWRRVSGLAKRMGAGSKTARQLWVLAMLQLVGVLAALGATVAAPYRSFYVVMWVFLLLGVNGVALGVRGQRLKNSAIVRFGWTTAVVSILVWGAGLLFPGSLRLDPLVESRSFELGFRLFALVYGVVGLFFGLKAVVAIGDVYLGRES